MASWRPGSLIDAFESPCDCFDLFLSNLWKLAVSQSRCGVTDEMKPCSRSILPAILAPGLVRALYRLVSLFQTHEVLSMCVVKLTLQISLLIKRRRWLVAESIAVVQVNVEET